MIEKIYTEQANEADFLIEYTQPPTAKSSAVQEPKPANKPLPSPSPSSSSSSSFSLKPSTIVMTKTSPIVAAALSCEEEDLYLMELNNKMASKHEREIFTDLIDTTNKHQIIKQVHDSIDNLKNQLLHKGMNKILILTYNIDPAIKDPVAIGIKAGYISFHLFVLTFFI